LKGNGDILFLDAPLETLCATGDRPLSSNDADLKKRYEERYGVYSSCADLAVTVTRDLLENTEKILKVLQ
jgi:shikimate kinase